MLNLSFDRPHGARVEPELFLRLNADPDLFLRLYRTILEAARSLGIGDDRVPDFLGIEHALDLLGQDELGRIEIDAALIEDMRDKNTRRLRDFLDDADTERLVEQRIRLGQHRFAAAVLDAFDHRCGFCGFSPSELGAKRMLIASHVKPWAACENNRERLDPRNGIAACPTHHIAFDTGLLTVNGGLRIHRATRLESRLGDRVTGSFFVSVRRSGTPRRDARRGGARYAVSTAGGAKRAAQLAGSSSSILFAGCVATRTSTSAR
jgi:putative restriction endonuclease